MVAVAAVLLSFVLLAVAAADVVFSVVAVDVATACCIFLLWLEASF